MINYTTINEYAINAIDNSNISNKDLVKNKYIDCIKVTGMSSFNTEIIKQDLISYINNFINNINCYTGYLLSVKMIPTKSNTTEKPDYKSLATIVKVEQLNALPNNYLQTVHILKQNDVKLMENANTMLASYITTLTLNITNAVDSNKVVGCTLDYTDYYNATFNGSSATGTIESLMNRYSYEWVPNAGAANIGIIFLNSKSGSFLNPDPDGKGTTNFVCWPANNGYYMFMTPCDSGFLYSAWGKKAYRYSTYSEAQNALKKKVITVNF